MLNITVKEQNKVIILSLEGDMVFNELREVEEIFTRELAKKPSAIGINCKHLRSLDSSGLGMLIQFTKDASAASVPLPIIDIPENITRVFDSSKLEGFFEMMNAIDFEQLYVKK